MKREPEIAPFGDGLEAENQQAAWRRSGVWCVVKGDINLYSFSATGLPQQRHGSTTLRPLLSLSLTSLQSNIAAAH